VHTRTGTTVTTAITRRYPDVFRFLCRWMHEAQPFQRLFPCTSISLNYDYAARRHRDANNVGPSVTKAFGDFVGGVRRS